MKEDNCIVPTSAKKKYTIAARKKLAIGPAKVTAALSPGVASKYDFLSERPSPEP